MGPDQTTKKKKKKSDVDRVRERSQAPTRRGDNPFKFNRSERLSTAKKTLRNEEMTQKYGRPAGSGSKPPARSVGPAHIVGKTGTDPHSGNLRTIAAAVNKPAPISTAPPGTGPRATTMSTKGTAARKGADPSTFVKPSPFRPSEGGKKTGLGRLGQILAGNKANIQSKALERMKKSGR